MSEKVILPIVSEPILNSYVHHAYPCTIIEDKSICTLYISNNQDHIWEFERTNAIVEYSAEQQMLTICNTKDRTDSCAVIKRCCNNLDEVVVKVNQFTLMDSLSYIRMSIGNHNQYQEEKDVFFRWNQYDITVEEKLIAFEGHFDVYYRMRRNGNSIEVCASQDNFSWVPVYSKEFEFDKHDVTYFYIRIFYGENYFEYWKNMNYIQLIYREYDCNTVYLDYFTYPRKRYDASYQEFSYFLDTEYLLLSESLDSYGDIKTFIKDSIRHGYYINIDIDEQYIPERQDIERKEYYHFNLFYGYDDNKEVFHALGYTQSGKLKTAEISYHILRNNILGNNIVRYKKNINTQKYIFSIEYVLGLVKEYFYGIDSSRKYMGVIGRQEGVYGINIFNELLYTERGRELITSDRRLSYLLYEHCVLMIDRIDFLSKKGYLSEGNRDYLLKLAGEMRRSAEVLKNRVIKNIYKKNMEDNILSQVKTLYEIQKGFYFEMIRLLQRACDEFVEVKACQDLVESNMSDLAC